MIYSGVPVIVYHSVGVSDKNWQWSHLTCPNEVFENHLVWLKKKKFQSVSLQQLFEYMKNGSKLPSNPVALTFDDGYLDNWTYAYPLLKKYGFMGTIFVTPEFVDPTKKYRPNLEDVWAKRKKINELKNNGFLSWKEMELMEREVVIDIQSHALTHTWHFKSHRIIDFRHPGDPYIWITWNHHPDKKPYLQMDDEKLIDFGEPVYEFGKSLAVKKYFPDENLSCSTIQYVIENGGKLFFKGNWQQKLFEVAEKYQKKNGSLGRYETDLEYENRVREELQRSKEIIEEQLNKEVKFLAWPGGGVNRVALKIASELGFVSSTYSTQEIGGRRLVNKPGEDSSRIRRIGSVLYWDGKENNNQSKIRYQNGFLLNLNLSYFQEKNIVSPLSRILLAGISKLYKWRYSI